MSNSTGKELVRVDTKLEMYADSPAWQRLWLALEAENWRSLAFVPTAHTSAIRLAHGLASVAWRQRGAKVIVADLRSIGLPVLARAREELRKRTAEGDRVLIATQPIDENPTAVTIAREADRALLCVTLGRTVRSQVQAVLKQLGTNRFLGSVAIHSNEQ